MCSTRNTPFDKIYICFIVRRFLTVLRLASSHYNVHVTIIMYIRYVISACDYILCDDSVSLVRPLPRSGAISLLSVRSRILVASSNRCRWHNMPANRHAVCCAISVRQTDTGRDSTVDGVASRAFHFLRRSSPDGDAGTLCPIVVRSAGTAPHREPVFCRVGP